MKIKLSKFKILFNFLINQHNFKKKSIVVNFISSLNKSIISRSICWFRNKLNNIFFEKCNTGSGDDAVQPNGIFKQGDWTCASCANVNWVWRERCNVCNNLKPNLQEPRGGGKGGGYFDRGAVEKNEWQSDDEEIDEFGWRRIFFTHIFVNCSPKFSSSFFFLTS